MDYKSELFKLCLEKIFQLGLNKDARYRRRLNEELIEIDCQDEYQYFIDAVHNGSKWECNENNLLIPYLLGLCPDFDINVESAYIMGEYPDIDVDYLECVRDYLRNDWAPRYFGKENVCCIGTYATYNLKQSLQDMARIFGTDRKEVLEVTKNFPKKDDEGEALTWDTALEVYPNFKKYVEKYPDLAAAAKSLCGRNKSIGQHAGGFIVSSKALDGFCPLMMNKKDSQLTTAWAEGQAVQDLQPVGLIKFDLLCSKMLKQVTDCIGLIRQRYGIEKMCAIEGGPHWSDHSYLNDEQSLKLANRGDLKFIFQFHSDGIRNLVRSGGVTHFNDLVAYSALYRPALMQLEVHDAYVRRKTGQEKIDIHPKLYELLKDTYGVMVYQEDVMRVLNEIGNIPMRDTYALIKAISKKKIEKFVKYKELFLRNATINLESAETAIELWKYIESFAGYGFNLSHSCVYSIFSARQLYLKTHYPLEFFCSMLNHIKGDDDKVRDCIKDARSRNIKVNPLDINKSQDNFSIIQKGDKPSAEDEIYFGFSNIKFLGKSAAASIISIRGNNPYHDLEDFMRRYGTDAKSLRPLILLRAFKGDVLNLYQYYQSFKSLGSLHATRKERFNKSVIKYNNLFKELTGSEHNISEAAIERYIESCTDKIHGRLLRRLLGNYRRSLTSMYGTIAEEDDGLIHLKNFEPDPKMKIDPKVLELIEDQEKSQMMYYGFSWIDAFSNCPDIQGYTLYQYNLNKYEKYQSGPVEAIIKVVHEKLTKTNSKYYLLDVVDANWDNFKVTVWTEEWNRFKDRLVVGNVVRLRVSPPNPKYAPDRYTLESYPKWLRKTAPHVDVDPRVVVLKQKEKNGIV